MKTLPNHPGAWLSAPAADAFTRLETAHGIVPINSAGRTEGEQQMLINRWNQGGRFNRPPFLYAPARPASSSNHVRAGGIAVDTSKIKHMLKHGPRFGWFQTSASDPVHFEYAATRDPSAPQAVRPAVLLAPTFPLPVGWYFGPKRGPRQSVSGFFGNREHLATWQNRMGQRGWKITADGLYGRQTAKIAAAFQAEKGLTVDRLIGPATWAAAWTAPVT